VRAKRVKRMSAAPKKAARTQAKKSHRLPPWVAGPGPILFGAACVACFVGAVALNFASESPRKADVAIAAAAPDAKAPVPQKPRVKAERPQATAAPSIDAKKTVAPEETQPAAAFSAPVQKVASVTITGCLEHDEEAFWLSDASGADAPTARSWKSGFLKKRPSRIELIDAAHALPLTSYVGHRVSATGTIVNREMQTRSLHPLSATCS
jgi:hypothetical protein